MLRGGLEWWHIVILLVVLFALFGYKKLPSATKSVAQSLKIFKEETKGLRGGNDSESPASPGEHVSSTVPGTAAIPAPVPTPVAAPEPVTVPAPAARQEDRGQYAEPASVAAPAPNAGPSAGAGQSLAPRPKSR